MAEIPTPIPQIFGIIPTGSPLLITPSSALSPTSYVYAIPFATPPRKPFTHLTVFLLPGVALPPATAAAVYLALPSAPGTFKFLGGIGENKESAVFKISGLSATGAGSNEVAEVDMDASEDGVATTPAGATGEVVLGISIEATDTVAAQIAALKAGSSGNGVGGNSQALVVAKGPDKKPDTLLLAQRIIKNAFNFLASFSGNLEGGIEVVPLKAFEEWWKKFEGKVRNDPGFLERDDVD